jgi:SAM-dependent methyltransferase
MFHEIAHFVRHAPATLALKRRTTQAELYETIISRVDEAGMDEHRAALGRGLRGRVLEIGAGTGAMFRHYGPDVDLVALEPDASFLELARPKAKSAACRVELVAGSAEQMPFADASFDGVVVALVMCSVPDIGRVLAEVVRVLRPQAPIRLIEHVKSPHAVAGALMSLLDPVWLALNGQGCHMNRDTEAELVRARLVLDDVRAFQLFAPGLPAFPMRRIEAHVAGHEAWARRATPPA